MVLEKRCQVYLAKVNKISHVSDRERMMDRTLSLTLSVLSRYLGDDNKQDNRQPQTARSPPAPPHLQLLPSASPPAEKQRNGVILKFKKKQYITDNCAELLQNKQNIRFKNQQKTLV